MLSFSILAVALLGADTPKKSSDEAKLQGVWYIKSVVGTGGMGGGPQPGPGIEFEGRRLKLYGHLIGHFRIDASKSPKQMDMIIERGGQAGKTVLCIYKFDGETLVICDTKAPGPRPKDFTVPEKEPIQHLFTYSRKSQVGE